MYQAIENTATIQLEGELGELRYTSSLQWILPGNTWKHWQALSNIWWELHKKIKSSNFLQSDSIYTQVNF